MLYYRQFESFDPKYGYLPSFPFSSLPVIGWKARELLSGRSTEQIESMAKKLSDEISAYYHDEKSNAIAELEAKFLNGQLSVEEFETFFEWDGGTAANGRWAFKDWMEDDLEILGENKHNEVYALQALIEGCGSKLFLTEYDPAIKPTNDSQSRDYEMFAVVSLWFIADAMNALRNGGWDYHTIAGNYLIESMAALSYAEHLRETQRLVNYLQENGAKTLAEALDKQKSEHLAWLKYAEGLEKKKLSEQARKAAVARHQPTNQAKEEIKKLWASGKYSSRDICAEQECAALGISFSTARKALRGTPNPADET